MNFIICAVFKNESHILDEWLHHYFMRGVNHIYLVNDNSTDNYLQILEKYSGLVTLFQNDIQTKEVGRQIQIYDKYFRPVLHTAKWTAILDLDEFLYSPTNISFNSILSKYDSYSQIKVDWLHFGSNGHVMQPLSVVNGFTKRSPVNKTKPYYSYKCIFKSATLQSFNVHENYVHGQTVHLSYSEVNPSDLVINHYCIQSQDFFMKVKSTRGDINNWFDHCKLKRDLQYFEGYDINELEDLQLYNQNRFINLSCKIPKEDEVTLAITSCNRPHLLDKTLESFVKMNTYPIKETIIIDDSGIIGCNDEVLIKYPSLKITSLYNKKNIGQVESIDKLYSYVRTKYIFHCEEDWAFLQPHFIEKSMNVFLDNPDEKIYTIWLRPHHSTSGHPIIRDNLNRGYYSMKKDFSYIDKGIPYVWGGITFNPGLRKTADCLKFHPYSLTCEKMVAHGKEYIGEYTINKKYVEDGYYAMILDDPRGHVDHIGWDHHIKRFWD
jgi:glycosyltransferase involved in cell wall biosynthesis